MLQVPEEEQKVSKLGDKSALPLRGGNWNNAAGAGVFALNLNNARAISNDNVGFRAALPSQPDTQGPRALPQSRGDKGACFRADIPGGKKSKPHGSR